MDEGYAAEVGSRDEPDGIADDAAAEGDDGAFPFESSVGEEAVHPRCGVEIFMILAGWSLRPDDAVTGAAQG